ncbi:MAG: phage holin family protein [Rubricoccaceae bacterium]
MPSSPPLPPAPPSASAPPLQPPIPETRQLPPHRGKLGRMVDHAAAVSADLREWVELRIALVQRQVLDKRDEVLAKKDEAIGIAKPALPAALLALYLLGFVLLTLAIGLGWWLGHPFWGFLIVTLLLAVVVGALGAVAKKRLDAFQRTNVELTRPPVTAADVPTPPQTLSPNELTNLEAQKARQAAA